MVCPIGLKVFPSWDILHADWPAIIYKTCLTSIAKLTSEVRIICTCIGAYNTSPPTEVSHVVALEEPTPTVPHGETPIFFLINY